MTVASEKIESGGGVARLIRNLDKPKKNNAYAWHCIVLHNTFLMVFF